MYRTVITLTPTPTIAGGYIGESDDGSHYFEVYRDGMPDDPVITMWVNVYDDHIEPILDGYDWVLDQNITESDAYKFNLYPYNDSISLFMYDYEGDDVRPVRSAST